MKDISEPIANRQKPIAKNKTFWVMVITGAGMGLSLLVRGVLIPKRFGFSNTADALTAALTVVLVVDTIVREGAKFSLVPLFVTREKEMPRTTYQDFTNRLLFAALGIGFGIFIFIEFSAPYVAGLLLAKSTVDPQTGTILLRLCAPLVIFGCGSTVLGAFLNSRQHFKTVALRNALPAGTAAAIFLLLWTEENLLSYIAVAYTAGFAGYFGWLCIGVYRSGHRYTLIPLDKGNRGIGGFRQNEGGLRELKNTVSLPTLGFAIRQITNRLFVEIYLVSQLGEGAITLYKSAFQIFSALQTLIGISIATTGLPDMATAAVRSPNPVVGRTLKRTIRTAVIIGAPVTLILLIFHGKISWLLYGNSTTASASVALIGQLLFWLGTGMIFSCLIPVLNAGLYAQKAYRSVFANMVTMAFLNVVVAYGLIGVLQLRGIALAVSTTALLAVGNLTYLLRRTRVSWF